MAQSLPCFMWGISKLHSYKLQFNTTTSFTMEMYVFQCHYLMLSSNRSMSFVKLTCASYGLCINLLFWISFKMWHYYTTTINIALEQDESLQRKATNPLFDMWTPDYFLALGKWFWLIRMEACVWLVQIAVPKLCVHVCMWYMGANVTETLQSSQLWVGGNVKCGDYCKTSLHIWPNINHYSVK